MKSTYYFSHDIDARNDVKLQEVLMKMGYEGIGLYWSVVEMLYTTEGKGDLSKCDSIAFALRIDVVKLEQLINIAFEKNDEYFWSNTIIERIKLQKDKSKKAKNSAQSRWKNEPKKGNAPSNADEMRTHSDGNANKVNKSKVNKIKENKEIDTPSPEKSLKYLDPIDFSIATELSKIYLCTPIQVKEKAEELYNYCMSKGVKYKDYSAFLKNALKKDFGKRRIVNEIVNPIVKPSGNLPEISEEERKSNLKRIQDMREEMPFLNKGR